MSILNSILFGALQGLLEFLPVSSFGHILVLQKIFGLSDSMGTLFPAFLHLGTAFSLIVYYKKDVGKILVESFEMLMELLGNLVFYIHNKRHMDQMRYHRIISSAYRRFVCLIMLSLVPTALLGFSARNLVQLAVHSSMAPGICMLLNGVFLIIVDLSGCGGKKSPRHIGFHSALWMGICQGLSVFPGISRCGFTVGAGMFCGYSRKMAVKVSYLMSIPAVFGAFFCEIYYAGAGGAMPVAWSSCIAGTVGAFIAGFIFCSTILKFLKTTKLRIFAGYCFLAGAVILIGSIRGI